MISTNLTATSQLRGHETVLEPYNFANGKSATVFHDLDEFVTERMARFITGRHAQGRAECLLAVRRTIPRWLWSRRIIRPKLRPW